MSLQTRLTDWVTAVGTDIKGLRTTVSGEVTGSLTGLTTTSKTSLISAINEVNAKPASSGLRCRQQKRDGNRRTRHSIGNQIPELTIFELLPRLSFRRGLLRTRSHCRPTLLPCWSRLTAYGRGLSIVSRSVRFK